MKASYRQWLLQQQYQENTVTAQMQRARRVEEFYGDLDDHYVSDRLATLIETLKFSPEDQRSNRPNPTKIPIDGNILNNLRSYRDAIKRYTKFRDSDEGWADVPTSQNRLSLERDFVEENEAGQRFSLERDMQAALRKEIAQLEAGLTIADDGAERSVDSGFIDITARDASGATVVIELKAGVAGQRAIAQILSYMGDVTIEEEGKKVRGILVASDFDAKAKAAARMVPNLLLRKYAVRFMFVDGHS